MSGVFVSGQRTTSISLKQGQYLLLVLHEDFINTPQLTFGDSSKVTVIESFHLDSEKQHWIGLYMALDNVNASFYNGSNYPKYIAVLKPE